MRSTDLRQARWRPFGMRCMAGLLLGTWMTGCTDAPSLTPTSPPSVSSVPRTMAAADGDDVRALLARPLALRSVAGQTCPVTPPQEHSPVAQPADSRGPGPGPLYPITFYLGEDSTLRLRGTPGTDGLYGIKVVWASTPTGYHGPVVVRVDRVDGPGRGQVRLSYNPGASRGAATVFVIDNLPQDWPAFTYVSGPGCYAYQLDGQGFTQVIVFRVIA